jgi:hypothetical protein
MEIHEGVEMPGGPEEHGNNPFLVPVSVTISILAVLVAGDTLLSHRAHTEELLLQAHATDQWAYYQAKNIRLRQVQGMSDMLSVVMSQDKEKTEGLLQKYEKEAKRYEADKEDISEKAKELENDRDRVSRRADRFDAGEGLLEIGLVICSITLLTRRRIFWFGGMLIGAAGIVAALTALLVH